MTLEKVLPARGTHHDDLRGTVRRQALTKSSVLVAASQSNKTRDHKPVSLNVSVRKVTGERSAFGLVEDRLEPLRDLGDEMYESLLHGGLVLVSEPRP